MARTISVYNSNTTDGNNLVSINAPLVFAWQIADYDPSFDLNGLPFRILDKGGYEVFQGVLLRKKITNSTTVVYYFFANSILKSLMQRLNIDDFNQLQNTFDEAQANTSEFSIEVADGFTSWVQPVAITACIAANQFGSFVNMPEYFLNQNKKYIGIVGFDTPVYVFSGGVLSLTKQPTYTPSQIPAGYELVFTQRVFDFRVKPAGWYITGFKTSVNQSTGYLDVSCGIGDEGFSVTFIPDNFSPVSISPTDSLFIAMKIVFGSTDDINTNNNESDISLGVNDTGGPFGTRETILIPQWGDIINLVMVREVTKNKPGVADISNFSIMSISGKFSNTTHVNTSVIKSIEYLLYRNAQ